MAVIIMTPENEGAVRALMEEAREISRRIIEISDEAATSSQIPSHLVDPMGQLVFEQAEVARKLLQYAV